MTITVLSVFGTRPEAIKMAPVLRCMQEHPMIDSQVCVTGQHQQMLNNVLNTFGIKADFNLSVMEPKQSLSTLTSKILLGLDKVLQQIKPQLILVHGDTTTTLAASLSAYYHKIKLGHVEAGLRTKNLYSPWPEEANRKLAGALTHYHFAPNETARLNLIQEGVNQEQIFVTGNTVIGALLQTIAALDSNPSRIAKIHQSLKLPALENNRKIILVTGHRRESFGDGFKRICQAIAKLAELHPEVDIVYPVHLNPNVQQPVKQLLSHINNIYLIEPVDYVSFVYLMKRCHLILTDSGGIQEEAPSLHKPVVVMRETTERSEAIKAGISVLTGTNKNKIVTTVSKLLTDDQTYTKMTSCQNNPFGDSRSAERIVQIITTSETQVQTQESEITEDLTT